MLKYFLNCDLLYVPQRNIRVFLVFDTDTTDMLNVNDDHEIMPNIWKT